MPAGILLVALHDFLRAMGMPRELIAESAGNALQVGIGGLLLLLVFEIFGRLARRWHKARFKPEHVDWPAIKQNWIVERRPSWRMTLRIISWSRVSLMIVALLSSAYVWVHSTGNRIEVSTIFVWLFSITVWGLSFAPRNWNLFDWFTGRIDAWRRMRARRPLWLIVASSLVLLLGMNLRVGGLESSPPQMVSDHVENVKDAYRIRYDNYRPIIFTDHSSREPLHFYLLVAFSGLPGLEVNQYAYSLLSAIQGILTLPLIFMLAIELIGERQRNFGRVFALAATALVAVSYWHITMSRHGFRITLAPLLMTWSLLYYVRALRSNRQSDFVKSGIVLGFGLVSHQMIQMLPVIYVASMTLVLMSRRHSWSARLRYVLNLAKLAFCAFVVLLPLFHFWTEFPEAGFLRQNQNIFGDRPLSTEEQLAFLRDKGAPALLSNLRLTALMFHYAGDFVWPSALHDEPATDPLTAAFILLGIAAWLSLLIRKRDPVLFIIPIAALLMLTVPSLALAHPNYSPHYMRALSSLTPVFLIGGLPLAVFCWRIYRTLPTMD